MNHLSVSVIIPTHNRANLLGRSVRSVLEQLAEGDELIVVDDGSTDDTSAVLAALSHPALRTCYQPQSGAGAARNRGIAEARCDLVAFLDSDDEWLPGKLDLQRQLMAACPDVLFCFTDLGRDYSGARHALAHNNLWHDDPREWDEIMGPPVQYSSIAVLPRNIADFPVHFGDIYRGEMHTNYLSTICLMARRRESGDALHFNERVATYEDWECLGRLAGRGRAAFLDRICALQHKHAGPRITDANWVARAESRLAVLACVWGADPRFLASHGDEYRSLVHAQQLARIRGLIVLNRMAEARCAIAAIDTRPARLPPRRRLPRAAHARAGAVAPRHRRAIPQTPRPGACLTMDAAIAQFRLPFQTAPLPTTAPVNDGPRACLLSASRLAHYAHSWRQLDERARGRQPLLRPLGPAACRRTPRRRTTGGVPRHPQPRR